MLPRELESLDIIVVFFKNVMFDMFIYIVYECKYARLTVTSDTGCTFPSSANCATFWIRPMAIMETSGRLSSGEPNFPPIAPMLLKVIVPPHISSEVNLLSEANRCNLASSLVIFVNKENYIDKNRFSKNVLHIILTCALYNIHSHRGMLWKQGIHKKY